EGDRTGHVPPVGQHQQARAAVKRAQRLGPLGGRGHVLARAGRTSRWPTRRRTAITTSRLNVKTLATLSPVPYTSRCRRWYTRCGTDQASHAIAAVRTNARVPSTRAAIVTAARARLRPPKSRTRCSLYGPSTATHWRPPPGNVVKKDRGANVAHTPSWSAVNESNSNPRRAMGPAALRTPSP